MKLTYESHYFRFFEGAATTVPSELRELLRQYHDDMPEEYRAAFRVLIFIDAGLNAQGLPLVLGLTSEAACFDMHMPELHKCFPAIEKACTRLGAISQSQLRVGFGRFGPDEYRDMRRYTIYNKRIFCDVVADWLLVKNISRRAGHYGWLWKWFVQRFDDKDPLS